MMVGALVLDEGISGITEASQTRRPARSAHTQVRSHDRGLVTAHAAGADRVVIGLGNAAGIVEKRLAAGDIGAGQRLAPDR